MLRAVIVSILLGVASAGVLSGCRDSGDDVHCGCAVAGGPFCRFVGGAGYTCASYNTYDSSTDVTCAPNGAAASGSLAAQPAAAPPGSGGPTQAEINTMLSEHNKYRAWDGAAALTWDATLASKAQAWAAKGSAAHSTALGAFKTYGENVHYSMPHDTPVQACKWWHDEITKYTGGDCFQAAHYTQMVWKSTTKVGCGKGPAPGGSGDLWVCQYTPMGNVFGQFVANVKQPGSRLRLYLSEGVVLRHGAGGWVGGMFVGASLVSAAIAGRRLMSRRIGQPTIEMQADEEDVPTE